jgi:S1-C subfamily serine protease
MWHAERWRSLGHAGNHAAERGGPGVDPSHGIGSLEIAGGTKHEERNEQQPAEEGHAPTHGYLPEGSAVLGRQTVRRSRNGHAFTMLLESANMILRKVTLAILTAAVLIPLCTTACTPPQPAPSADKPGPAQATGTTGTTGAAPAATPAAVEPLTAGARIEDERNTISVFRAASPSTVYVTQTRVVVDDYAGTMEEVPAGSGSGFVWDAQGHVVTNYHVVEKAQSVLVTFQDQKTYPAKVVGVEPRKDIAVLKVEAPAGVLVPTKIPKHVDLEVGQKTIAIGNPFGLDHTLTTGVISALGRQVQGIGNVTIRDMIQTDAAINPGNSGGPLLDSSGQLIGMNTMIYSRTGSSAGIGFAVPVSTVMRVVPQIIKNGKADQLGIGVNVDPLQQLERRFGIHGVVVRAVIPGSPAERSGLKGIQRTPQGFVLGDVIVAIDEHPVENFDDLYSAVDAHKPGDKVDVKLRRGEQLVTSKVEVIVLP